MSENARPAEAGRSKNAILRAGIAAGVLGAALKVGYLVFAAIVHGKPPLLALRPLGATFRGEDVVLAGPGSFLYGFVVLALACAVFGALFAALLPPDFELGGAAVLGMGYGLFLMSVLTSAVLPDVNPVLRSRMPALGGSWVVAAALWGAALGIVPRLRRRAEGRNA